MAKGTRSSGQGDEETEFRILLERNEQAKTKQSIYRRTDYQYQNYVRFVTHTHTHSPQHSTFRTAALQAAVL